MFQQSTKRSASGTSCTCTLRSALGKSFYLQQHFWDVVAELVQHDSLELTVWFVHSLWENAIAISLVGFFLGPIYPILMLNMTKLIPPRSVVLTGSYYM